MEVILLKSNNEDSMKACNDPYFSLLKKHNVTVDFIETFSFNVCGCLFERLYKWRSAYSCIVFCSPRAVYAYESTDLIGLSDDLCFVVGSATGDAATKLGFQVKGSHAGNAEKLANYILENHMQDVSAKPILLLVGAKHSPVLPYKLRNAGLTVEEVVVYVSLPNQNCNDQLSSLLNVSLRYQVKKSGPQCLVFFSPSGVELAYPVLSTFLERPDSNLQLFAIGPTTGSMIESLNLPLTGICQSPTPESLLECLSAAVLQSK